jgi:hypothetical protein
VRRVRALPNHRHAGMAHRRRRLISEWRVTDTGHHLCVTYSEDAQTEIIVLPDARTAAEVFEDVS